MVFSPETLQEHRSLKTSVWNYVRGARLAVILSVPVIYACVIPFLLLDLFITVYRSICFPIYRIPGVRRSDYLTFDRGKLAYLNALEKFGCVYCSYANGLPPYVTEVAARTEQHFCPIRQPTPVLHPHSRYEHFVPYGDAQAYRAHVPAAAQGAAGLTHKV